MTKEEIYMSRCLDLASNGLGLVAPNPMVGCVITHDDRIIGEGYHHVYGGPHAEVNAIRSVIDSSLLPHATLFVNLEPCAHFGKTPPCTDLIIESGIKRVFIGTADPFPKVAGRGISKLQENGLEVITGVLSEQCAILNKRFFSFHEKKRPYVTLKWAQTADGFIDIERIPGSEARPTWITSERLRVLVHKWRSEESGIMVGTNTVVLDNPRLNVRDWHGKQPLRIIIDRTCSLKQPLNILDNTQDTIIFNQVKNCQLGRTRWVRLAENDNMLPEILHHLYQDKVQSILVEGGRALLQSFIDQALCDEARVFSGPQFFGKGCKAPITGRFDPSQVILGNENFFWFSFNSISK